MSNAIVEFNEFEAKITEFRNRYDGVVYDLTIPEQEKKARSDRFSIGKIISALDARHKEIKAPLKEKVDLIDGERKRIKDELLEVQDKIKSQIEAHEAKIAAHKAELQARVDAIRANSIFDGIIASSGEISKRITALETVSVDDSFEGKKADAALALMETRKFLNELLVQQNKFESEQAELKRLREESEARVRAEREENIRKEAAEKARQEAEAAARKQVEQAEKAKRDAEAREARMKQEAEAAKVRAEQQAKEATERAVREERARAERDAAAKAKADAETRAKEEKAKLKKAHTNKVESEATKSLMAAIFELDEAHSRPIIEAIRDGKIAHVTLNY